MLTNEQKGILLDAIFDYSEKGSTTVVLEPVLEMAFNFIKEDLDINRKKYEAIVKRNRVNGLKGGRPKSPENPVGSLGTQGNPEKPKKADSVSVNVSDNVSDNVNENDSDKKVVTEVTSKNADTKERNIELIDYFREKLGSELDGTSRDNWRYCTHTYNKIKRMYPDKDTMKGVKVLIDVALADDFHSQNTTNFRYIFKNILKIIKSVAKSNSNLTIIS